MSINPRKANGTLNPRYKRLVNERLDTITENIKKAEKEYKKIGKLTIKAGKANDKEKDKAKKKKIKNL